MQLTARLDLQSENVALAPGATALALQSEGTRVRLIEPTEGALLGEISFVPRDLNWRKETIYALKFTPDAGKLAVMTNLRNLSVWNTRTCRLDSEVASMEAEDSYLTLADGPIDFSCDGRLLGYCTRLFETKAQSNDYDWHEIEVFDTGNGARPLHKRLRRHPINFTFDRYRPRVAIAEFVWTTVHGWKPEIAVHACRPDKPGGQLQKLELEELSFSVNEGCHFPILFTRDGKRVLIGARGAVGVFDLSNGRLCQKFAGHEHNVEGFQPFIAAMAVDSQERYLAVGGEKGTVALYDMHSGSTVASGAGHDEPVKAVAFVPDAQRLVSVSCNRVCVWACKE